MIAKKLQELGFAIVATRGTQVFLKSHGVIVTPINKVRDGSPHIVDELSRGSIDMVINTPEGSSTLLDSRSIRSTSTELGIPLFTTLAAADAATNAIEQLKTGRGFEVCSIQEYLESIG